MRQHPLTTSAALLLNQSLLITSPASRLRTGWLGLSVGLHLLAGAGLFALPLFQFDSLERPSLDRKDIVISGSRSKARLYGDGDNSKSRTPDQAPKQPAVKPSVLKVPVLHPEQPAAAVKPVTQLDPGATGPGTSRDGVKDGERWGTGGPDDHGDGIDLPGLPTGDSGPPGTGQETYHIFDMNDPPKLVSREDPVYPESARQQGIEGNVDLKIIVDETGRVVDVIVVRSDNPLLNANAVAAVRRWKYSAGHMDGRAVRTYNSVRIHFTLHG